MTQPVTESLLRAMAARAAADENGGQVIAVASAGPWQGPSEVETEAGRVEVRSGPSVLAVRELLAHLDPAEDRTVILLTSIPEEELGDEVLARLWRHRLQQPSGWEAAKQLFRVDRMDPALGSHRWLVDLLVDVAPSRGYPPPPGGFLDLDTAWRSFLRFGLRLEVERPEAEDLLAWGESDSARTTLQDRVRDAGDAVAGRLALTAGPLARHIVRLASTGKGRDLIPLGLVSDTLWSDELEEDARVTTARVRLEGPLGERGMTGEVARTWGRAAVNLVLRAHALSNDPALQRWLSRAESILVGELGAAELASASDVLPTSFEQRLGLAGRALGEAVAKAGPAELKQVRRAVERVERHLRARDGADADRLARLQMAERLVRRLQQDEGEPPRDLADAARAFLQDGAWMDRAREALSHGETVAALAEAYGGILNRIDAMRLERDREFARLLARWSKVDTTGRAPLLPIENVLDQVVVPIATKASALLLVLDGWSHPEATRLAEDLQKAGWVRQMPLEAEHPILLSALPSVTSVSRTSLLSGRLAHGTQEDERRNWSEHEGLKAVSRRADPRLFHRRDLGAVDGHMAREVRDAILTPDLRVVGVVVNALDEHLDKGGQLRLADGLQGIRPLRPLLDAGMESGRVVILVSDHGHVLETGSSVALHGGSGERWRPDHPPATKDEVEIRGSRVLFGKGKIVVPATEKLRYISAEKRGYHGGATPQEVLCPLLVMTPPGLGLPGWGQAHLLPPAWWQAPKVARQFGTPGALGPGEEVNEEPVSLPTVDPDGQGQLFGDLVPAKRSAEPSLPPWIPSLLESPILRVQREAAGRQSLGDEDLKTFLRLLHTAGGVVPVQVLAQELALPLGRVFSKLAVLRRMLNLDGYAVVTMEGDQTVRFDRDRLIRQFKLDA